MGWGQAIVGTGIAVIVISYIVASSLTGIFPGKSFEALWMEMFIFVGFLVGLCYLLIYSWMD